MRSYKRVFPALICSIAILYGCGKDAPENVSFSGHLMPILTRHCLPCHDRQHAQGNIILTSYSEMMESRYLNRTVPIAIEGKPQESRLYIVVVTRQPGVRMPPEHSDTKSLSKRQAEFIRVWIEEGARDN